MNTYYKIINAVLILCAIAAFYLAFKNSQIPFDENGRFITEKGVVYKKFGTVKYIVLGVLSIASIFIWNTIKKRINKK